MRIEWLKKACITSLWFKNRTQKLDFLEIRYYANSVLLAHFFKIKLHRNVLCLLVSGKLKFSGQISTCPTNLYFSGICYYLSMGKLLEKLISTPEYVCTKKKSKVEAIHVLVKKFNKFRKNVVWERNCLLRMNGWKKNEKEILIFGFDTCYIKSTEK